MQKSLKLAFIHPRLKQGDLVHNLAKLLRLNRTAARSGADILINPELCLSGYSFQGRDEIAPFSVGQSSPEISSFAELARKHGAWVCLGYAENDPSTGVFYNSALLLNSEGEPAAVRRKVTAEPRWACPGPPAQHDVCDTPWGRFGLSICSETYFGLLPRIQALKGVDLLLVPANWPAEGLDPRELWRARSLENGFALAACNRSGRESGIDFGNAPSCLLDHEGREITLWQVEDEIFLAELPLEKGCLGNLGAERLTGRKPRDYHSLYAYLRQAQEDMGTYYDLPEPGELSVHCLPGDGEGFLDGVSSKVRAAPKSGRDIFLLPGLDKSENAPELLSRLARKHKKAFMAGLKNPDGSSALIFVDENGKLRPEVQDSTRAFHLLNWGPARLGLARARDLAHPEAAAALAKLGCDLVLASGVEDWPGAGEILAIKSLERLAVAVALPGIGLICLPPEGHQRWREITAGAGGLCSRELHTGYLRKKFFMDLVDYECLFQGCQADGKPGCPQTRKGEPG